MTRAKQRPHLSLPSGAVSSSPEHCSSCCSFSTTVTRSFWSHLGHVQYFCMYVVYSPSSSCRLENRNQFTKSKPKSWIMFGQNTRPTRRKNIQRGKQERQSVHIHKWLLPKGKQRPTKTQRRTQSVEQRLLHGHCWRDSPWSLSSHTHIFSVTCHVRKSSRHPLLFCCRTTILKLALWDCHR